MPNQHASERLIFDGAWVQNRCTRSQLMLEPGRGACLGSVADEEVASCYGHIFARPAASKSFKESDAQIAKVR